MHKQKQNKQETNFKTERNLKKYLRMQIPIFLKNFVPLFLNLNVLPLSSKYSNSVSMLHTSQHQYSNVQAYAIANTQTFRFCKGFRLIYQKKEKSHAPLICFHYFSILLVQSKHKYIKTPLCSVMLSSCYATLNS